MKLCNLQYATEGTELLLISLDVVLCVDGCKQAMSFYSKLAAYYSHLLCVANY